MKDDRIEAGRRRDAIVQRIADIVRRSGIDGAEQLIADLEREWPRPDPSVIAIEIGVEILTRGCIFDLGELELPWDVKAQVVEACGDRRLAPLDDPSIPRVRRRGPK